MSPIANSCGRPVKLYEFDRSPIDEFVFVCLCRLEGANTIKNDGRSASEWPFRRRGQVH
jgi:hypothetical protein